MQNHWRNLLNTFWFLPGFVSLLGPLLAFIFLAIDQHFPHLDQRFVFSGGSAEASTILSTIAGSLVTVAGLAFSITIVVLQLVSSQYTPRALRGFLQDRVTQAVAGGFFAIFAYSLIILTTIHDADQQGPSFIPTLSITIALVLGFLGLALLLIFIHHIGRIIQVSDIAAHLATQTFQAIDQQYPTWENDEGEVSGLIQSLSSTRVTKPATIYSLRTGYIQRIELSHMLKDIMQPGVHVHLLICPGDFVTEETVIAEVWPAEKADEIYQRALRHSIYVERERDIAQDPRFGIRQLADISLRALSPAINDPTTGILCINYLQAVFERCIRVPPSPTTLRFASQTSILHVRQPDFSEYLEVFKEISFYAAGNIRVIEALFHSLTCIAEVAILLNRQGHQEALASMATKIAAHAIAAASLESEKIAVLEQVKQIECLLEKVIV